MTSIRVTNEDTSVPVVPVAPVVMPTIPAADASVGSPIFNLEKRREEMESSLFLTLRIPRWSEPEIHVKYKPFKSDEVQSALETAEKSQEATVRSSAMILVDCCVEVYATMADHPGKKFSLRRGEQVPLPMTAETGVRFDPILAEALGLPPHLREAVAVVRKLYQTDGDVIDASFRVAEWSAQASETVDSDF